MYKFSKKLYTLRLSNSWFVSFRDSASVTYSSVRPFDFTTRLSPRLFEMLWVYIAALALTLTTNLAQAVIVESQSTTLNVAAAGDVARTSSSYRFWIHENSKRDFYNQWAADLGLRGEYNTVNFRKFQAQLRRLASEYATVAFTRAIESDYRDHQRDKGLPDEWGSVYYNLPRKLSWKVNSKGQIVEMHKLELAEIHRLVQDLIEDRDPRAIIDLLKIASYLSAQDQRKVSDHVSKKLDDPDWIKQNGFYSYFSEEQVSRIQDYLRRLQRADELERSRIWNELDDVCKARGAQTSELQTAPSLGAL